MMNTRYLSHVTILGLVASLLYINGYSQISTNSLAVEPATVVAKDTRSKKNATVFVARSSNGFSDFVSAALLKHKVPIRVTVDEEFADYILVTHSVRGENRWYDTVFGAEKDRNLGSMKLIRVSDKTIVWATSSGDKSFWFSGIKSMGPQKVADRLANRLKKDLPDLLDTAEIPVSESTAVRKKNVAEILNKESNGNSSAEPPKPTPTAESLTQEGIDFFRNGRYQQAEEAFRQGLRLTSSSAALRYNLGTALSAQNRIDEAIREIEIAIKLDPQTINYKRALDVLRGHQASKVIIH